MTLFTLWLLTIKLNFNIKCMYIYCRISLQNCCMSQEFMNSKFIKLYKKTIYISTVAYIFDYATPSLPTPLKSIEVSFYFSNSLKCCLWQTYARIIDLTIHAILSTFYLILPKLVHWQCSRCSFSMMVKWANDGLFQANDS